MNESDNDKDKVIVFFDGEHDDSLLAEYVDNAGETKFEFIKIFDVDEVSTLIDDLPKAVLLFEIYDKMSFGKVYKLLRSKRDLIKNNNLKVSGYNHSEHPQIVKALNKLGVTEILEHDLKPRTISFKIQFWEKALKNKVKGATSVSSNNSNEPIVYITPLDVEENIWIIANKNEIKKILRNFLISLYGVNPDIGSWDEYFENDRVSLNKWVWKFKDPEDSLSCEEGEWVYKGSRPDFDYKQRRWFFIGQDIALYFKKNDEEKYLFKVNDDGVMEIAENSTHALEKKQNIKDTHDNLHVKSQKERDFEIYEDKFEKESSDNSVDNKANDVAFKKDDSGKELLDNLSDTMSNDKAKTELPKNEMNGSFSDEKIESIMTGKTGTSSKIDDNMKGTFEPEQFDKKNSGNVSADNLGDGKLRGKRTGKDIQANNLKSKSSESNVIEADFGNNSIKKDEVSSDLFGNTSAENHGKNNLKGNLGAVVEQFQEEPERELDNNIAEIVERIDKATESEEIQAMLEEGEFSFESYLRVKDSDSNEGIIVDFFEDNLDFISEDGDYTVGEEITLTVLYKYQNDKIEIQTKGEVVYAASDEGDLVTVKLIDFPQGLLADMLKQFEERQGNIDNFMKMAKGY
jgi:hypothetical protein